MRTAAVTIVAAGIALAGCGGAEKEAASPSPSPSSRIPAAVTGCDSVSLNAISDGGTTVTMKTKGTVHAPAATFEGIMCVLKKLGAGTAVLDHIGTTRALDGQQTDEWDGVKARWTYHPDDGLQITVVDTRAPGTATT